MEKEKNYAREHITVGNKVRIRGKPFWHKALISVIEADQCEVVDLYSEDEKWVLKSSIEPLLDFEASLSDNPEQLKKEGNILFKLPDPHSAWQRYHRGRAKVDKIPPVDELIGCEVLYKGNIGMVSDVDESGIAEVCFDEGDIDCPVQDLIRVYSVNGQLQCSLYSNEIMALFKLQKYANALKLCHSLQILSTHFSESKFQQKAAFWKCKILIRKRKFQLASHAVAEYKELGGTKCENLENEIRTSQKKYVQSNKRLAKSIAQWTDQVLKKKEDSEKEPTEFSEDESSDEPPPSGFSQFLSSYCQYFCALFMIVLILSQISLQAFTSSNGKEL